MLPDLADMMAGLRTGPLGQIKPSLRELEQMRLVGRGSSSASKFHGDYGVSSVFVFFSDYGGHACQQMHHATIQNTTHGDAFPELGKNRMWPVLAAGDSGSRTTKKAPPKAADWG